MGIGLLLQSKQLFAQNVAGARPNIIYMMSDDHAYQAISAYGKGLNHTPNIDKLADQG
ncbi:MAG: sulfatase, partial [Chitinophagaceae bacterium]